MKKKYKKKKKMNLKISLLKFNFAMIYKIHKLLLLLKNHLNYLKDIIFECFFKKYDILFFFKEKIFFSQHIMMENPRPKEKNIIKDIKNLVRLKK